MSKRLRAERKKQMIGATLPDFHEELMLLDLQEQSIKRDLERAPKSYLLRRELKQIRAQKSKLERKLGMF